MKIAILDDYLATLPTLSCFAKLDGHDVRVWSDHTDDIDILAESGEASLRRSRSALVAELVSLTERRIFPVHPPPRSVPRLSGRTGSSHSAAEQVPAVWLPRALAQLLPG